MSRGFLAATIAAAIAAVGSATKALRQEVEEFKREHPNARPSRARRTRWRHFERVARAERRFFVKGGRWFLRPHSPHQPKFIAVVRTSSGGRKYHQCHTRDQAMAHKPYLIEHVNGFGQVTHRERLLKLTSVDQPVEGLVVDVATAFAGSGL
jgi:hypothetical protein